MSSATIRSMPPTPTTPNSSKNKKSKKKKKANTDTRDQSTEILDKEDSGEQVDLAGHEESGKEGDTDLGNEEHRQGASMSSARSEVTIQSREAFPLAESATQPKVSHEYNGDTQSRLDALLHDRETLRAEVTKLRQSLEEVQSKHNDQLGNLSEELVAERTEKESAQEQYQSLLGRVNTIRTQLTERLKADAEQLAEARVEIDELKSKNLALLEDGGIQRSDLEKAVQERDERLKELSTLRNRATLSQQNWNEERDDLIQREALAREEFENAKQAMQDWEILAMEERNIRQGVESKMSELQEETATQRDDLDKIKQHRDTQANTIEGLQNGLQEIQVARKQELREIVEKTQSEITRLRDQVDEARKNEAISKTRADDLQLDCNRLLPLEAELKEKNLLIGKLRHEAVILNDHLTKALRQLKRGKTEDVIDRQLVTNHFLQFLGLTHGDPKKFQILQIIAAMLNWTDEQREQAGLSRPGASNPSLRNPIAPWHRTPSTPSLNAANLGAHVGELGTRKDSIAGLFSEFLESEADGGSSKATSVSESSRPAS